MDKRDLIAAVESVSDKIVGMESMPWYDRWIFYMGESDILFCRDTLANAIRVLKDKDSSSMT